MFRTVMSSAARGRRAIHHLVFIEDHTIITKNQNRLEHVRDALTKLAPKLKQDTATVVRLNSGYYRPNEEVEFKKGEFDVEQAMDLRGNNGPSGLWGNISRVVKHREDREVNMVVLTNGADDASKHPLRGEHGLQHMVHQLGDRNPGLRFAVSTIGFDVTRETERTSIRDGCNWTGGDALFIDCDGADDDGTTLCSAEATKFFDTFNQKDAKKLADSVKAAKAQFAANASHTSPLISVTHMPPTL